MLHDPVATCQEHSQYTCRWDEPPPQGDPAQRLAGAYCSDSTAAEVLERRRSRACWPRHSIKRCSGRRIRTCRAPPSVSWFASSSPRLAPVRAGAGRAARAARPRITRGRISTRRAVLPAAAVHWPASGRLEGLNACGDSPASTRARHDGPAACTSAAAASALLVLSGRLTPVAPSPGLWRAAPRRRTIRARRSACVAGAAGPSTRSDGARPSAGGGPKPYRSPWPWPAKGTGSAIPGRSRFMLVDGDGGAVLATGAAARGGWPWPAAALERAVRSPPRRILRRRALPGLAPPAAPASREAPALVRGC